MSLIDVVLFAVGAAILIVGADLLVRGASRIAARTGLSSVVIGLTVVAFGTSTPELAVSIQAAADRETDLAVGNVVGSNIANILLVLGLAALAGSGLYVAQRIVRIDVPIMVGASVLVVALALDNVLGRLDGIVLTTLLAGYVAWTVVSARGETQVVVAEYEEALDPAKLRATPLGVDAALIVAGLVMLIAGSRWLVDSATAIAEALGVSELVIGLTVVAVGTSMPEIATSVVAALRGERDLAVGNAVGSNLFNLLGVLGVTAVVAPAGVAVTDQALRFDLPVMTAVAVACLPVFFTGYLLSRWEGAVLFGYYGAYILYLVLDATDSGARDPFAAAMSLFVLPLTVLTLGIIVFRAWRKRHLPSATRVELSGRAAPAQDARVD